MRPGALAAVLACCASAVGAQPSRLHAGAPAVSPDGRMIAYVGDREDGTQIFVNDADGGREVQLTHGSFEFANPRWSSDGKQVLFAAFAHDTSVLYGVGPSGDGRRQLATVPGRNPLPLPDGRRVVFSTGGWTTMQLATARPDGSDARRISDGIGAIWNPHLSPDGGRIAYTRSVKGSPVSVWVSNVDGSDARQVTHFTPAEGGAQVPAWSPDGTRLAVQSAVPSATDPAKRVGHVWIVDLTTGTATKLAPHDAPYLDETPAWFPDGRRIAFQSDRSGRMEVWVMNADGTAARQVTK